MGDSSAVSQAALIARYRGDATLQGLMTGAVTPEWNIFDQGGAGLITPVFPYIFVHPITMAPGTVLAMGQDANDVFMQVSVFTNDEGFAQARVIANRVYVLTDGKTGAAPFTLSGGFSNVWAVFENRNELEEVTDRLIQHIADRYKLWNQG